MNEGFKHTIMKRHPLRDCWMVWVPEFPYVAPFFGSEQECKKARAYAERKAEIELTMNKEL